MPGARKVLEDIRQGNRTHRADAAQMWKNTETDSDNVSFNWINQRKKAGILTRQRYLASGERLGSGVGALEGERNKKHIQKPQGCGAR